jgi:hypothetical protein
MNDYDNRQLIGRGQRLPYVNDHDKSQWKQGGHRRLQVHAETERVYDAGKETFTKEHLKNNSKNFSRERLQRLLW